MRYAFVHLPVKDLDHSRRFFGELGFEFNEQLSDERTASLIIDENVSVMLLAEDRFREFINGNIADPDTTEVLVSLSAESREEVDRTVEKAIAFGGSQWKEARDEHGIYNGSFRDPDGHIWELAHMDL